MVSVILLRMMWKDWGFAESLFSQAKAFLQLASDPSQDHTREAYIRAAIVFFQMAFEAYFRDATRGYIQQHRAAVPPAALQKVEAGMQKNTGISDAVRDWPKWLTGKSLDTRSELYRDFGNFIKYRNALVHGRITAKIPSWGKLAQEVETAHYAALAHTTTTAMVKTVAAHLDFATPAWAS